MKARRVLIASIAAAALALTGCASGADEPGTSGAQVTFEKKNPLKIGYSTYDLQSPYWQAYTKGIKDEGAAQKIEIVVADQKSSEQNQVSGSADLINQGISALIITPVQPPALPATITAAHNAKIPIIVADIGAEGDYDAFILSDNRAGGALAAKEIESKLAAKSGTKKVGVIELHSGSAVGDDRVGGFKDEIAKNKDFEIVASLDGNDTVEGGFKAAQDMLAANPDLDAIYAANDPSAQGAARALQAAGKSLSSGFVLVGFNGDDPSLDLIKSGEQSATIAQDPYGQGRLAVKTAIALLDGKDAGFSNAEKRVIEFPVTVVNSDNLESFRAERAKQG
ncbi:sugar ABC transporter substrate-binding protein [Mycetocola tolaasinivorans]|uniref:Sugar ABC transporter substrate-binding protein n=1 Tax=Mycetocola tolaasinivorans TaxID=76635 RepID=A0A3L7A2T0_9MICO|nr:substrate-binding domain-containing protein [Mycetocola tolaasinivorans]RLP74549.1 sugar ABC transporter substrate-binding protein [Mycetocola tolaasinivorans]